MPTTDSLPRGKQIKSDIPGKMQNCNTWAEYEPPMTSTTACLCSGGVFEGEIFDPCPVQAECRTATRRRAEILEEKPRVAPEIRFGRSTVVASSNAAQTRPSDPYRWQPGAVPTTAPRITQPVYTPQAVIPPESNPKVMQTPFAAALPSQPGGNVSPTFLPMDEEDVWSRLGRNITQGWINSTGWHVFDYTRNVDLFRRR